MAISALIDKCGLSTFIALDLETTGLECTQESIIEVSAVKFIDGKQDSIFSHLIDPQKPISSFIQDLTGINDSMVRGKPFFDDILDDLIAFVGNFPVVGHNVKFDIGFIKEHSKGKLNLWLSNQICDTYLLSKIVLFSNEEHSLESISEFYNLSIDGSHRATNDAINSGEVLIRLVQEFAEFDSNVISRIKEVFKNRDIENSIIFNSLFDFSVSDSGSPKRLSSVTPIINFKNKNNGKIAPLEDVVGSDGLLYANTNFEYRPLQHKMINHVEQGIANKEVSVVEAGTGLGKTYAYLIPYLYESKRKGIPVIVSTYTKSLQDQLFDKDLKNIVKLLDIDIKGILLKGRDNYICLHRLKSLESNSQELVRDFECHEISTLIAWSYYTKSGDVEECSSFSRLRNSKIWNLVKSDFRFCQEKCAGGEECYHSNILNNIKGADVIIVNHALLLSSVLDGNNLLPKDHLFVIDEAHDFFKAAKHSLTFVYDKNLFNDLLSDISILIKKNTKKSKSDKLVSVIDMIDSAKKEIELFFKSYLDINSINKTESQNYPTTSTFNDPNAEFQDCDPTLLELISRLNELSDEFLNIEDEIDSYLELEKSGVIELMRGFLEKTDLLSESIKSDQYISWMKYFQKVGSCSINYLHKDIGKTLYQKYFKNRNIGLLCSATLTVNNSFNYFFSSIGLDRLEYEQDIKKVILPTPFMLEEQLKFFSFKSELNINSDKYIENISEQIFEISNYYNKRMLVLCTSYKQASQIKNILKPKFSKINQKIFVHEKGRSKNSLIRAYRNTKNSVLVGTMAFWEGVDFPGDELSILMMIRIPFENPNNPYIKFRGEQLSSIGKDSFSDHQVPSACLKMKQGFGRLIRTEYDSGIFIITDPRIYNSSYGNKIINSFPVETISYSHFSTILNNKKIL